MSSDAKPTNPAAAPEPISEREKGVRIFTYPKLIFIFPTLVMSVICCFGMMVNRNITERPSTKLAVAVPEEPINPDKTTKASTAPVLPANHKIHDFKSPQNILAVTFLLVWAFNLLILTFDFPRFSIVAFGFLGTTAIFFLLWLATITDFLHPLVALLSHLYLSANSEFYGTFAVILSLMYAVVLLTRFLDYWEFMPNEILHHHGPWSDLERFPTMNLKFDKEIPDVFEHLLLGSGRLVFHVAGEQKAIILDNVLWINKKEEALKQIMSRLSVRVTTDQEVAQPLP